MFIVERVQSTVTVVGCVAITLVHAVDLTTEVIQDPTIAVVLEVDLEQLVFCEVLNQRDVLDVLRSGFRLWVVDPLVVAFDALQLRERITSEGERSFLGQQIGTVSTQVFIRW
ncbi:hypothetical protein D3C81_1992370 [compost metagenome]